MFDADLAFPFTLGLVAAFNPCGFAMLPIYVSFFLGQNSGDDTSAARNLLRALKVGLALTVGFIAVFGAFGLITSGLLSQGDILEYTPYVTFGLGFLLVPFGLAMLAGFEPKISVPRLDRGGDSGELLSMFLFGVSYAIVSLGCTVGLFIAGVSNVFTSDGFFDGVAVFVAYGLGMGAVIMTLTVGVAMARTSVATNMRKVLPWVNRISGVLLVLSGIYLSIYGWWEIQVLRGNLASNRLIEFFENMQVEINRWIDETGPVRLGVGLLLIVGAALLRGLWAELSPRSRRGGSIALGVAWVVGEFSLFVRSFDWDPADLFILPTIRTILDIPARFGNWFTDPIRWAVLGELIVVAILAWTAWFRLARRRREAEATAGQLVDASV